MRLSALKNANLVLAFLLELGILAALLYWGWVTGSNLLAKIGLGFGSATLAVIIWAIFGAPRSAHRLSGVWYWLLRIIYDAVGVIALYTAGQRTLAVVVALLAALNCTLGAVWKQ